MPKQDKTPKKKSKKKSPQKSGETEYPAMDQEEYNRLLQNAIEQIKADGGQSIASNSTLQSELIGASTTADKVAWFYYFIESYPFLFNVESAPSIPGPPVPGPCHTQTLAYLRMRRMQARIWCFSRTLTIVIFVGLGAISLLGGIP